MNISTLLTPQIHEYVMPFYTFVCIYLSLIFIVFGAQIFQSLVRIIPRYFIRFDCNVSVIIFLISFSDSSLLVYRTANDFHMLILCLAILLKSLISSKRIFPWNV